VECYNQFLTSAVQEGTSSRLVDLEAIVASNHAELQDMLDNVQRQLQDIQNVMGKFGIIINRTTSCLC
jgi:hypothetical protein